MAKKGGLVNRILMGREKSEGYARSTLPSNRWELGWDIFKGKFGKMVIVNLLVMLFCLPLIFIFFFRSLSITSYGVVYPYSQSFGAGYMAASSMAGVVENITLNVNITLMLFLPLAFAVASIGLAGGAYVMRNMVWTEGIFVANDFWRGIKQNIWQILITALIYSGLLYLSMFVISYENKLLALGQGTAWIIIVSEVLTYVIMTLVTVICLHMITMSVTYKLKYHQLIKNAFLFTMSLLPNNLFFIILGLLPFGLLFFGSFFTFIGMIIIALFGFSYFLLVWTDYCQWLYDKFINSKIAGAKKNRGIYEKVKESDSEALKQYKKQLTVKAGSFGSRPVKPITDDELQLMELPKMFTREDLEKLNESKRVLYEDNERYIEEHKNDPEFRTNEEIVEESVEAKKLDKDIEKAKKALDKHNKTNHYSGNKKKKRR